MKKEKNQKLIINGLDRNNSNQKIYNNNNILFYRKSSLNNNKTSFYHHKKDSSPSNILAQNQNNSKIISGSKKKYHKYNYSNEEETPSTNIKTVNHSKNKSSKKISLEDFPIDKANLNKTSISPFSLQSHKKFKENIFNDKLFNKINKTLNYLNTKPNNIFDYNNKNKNLQINNFNRRNKSFINLNLNISYGKNEKNQKEILLINHSENSNSFLINKTKTNKILKNFEKNGINLTFKNNNEKESNELQNEIKKLKVYKPSLNNSKNNNFKKINHYIVNNKLGVGRNDFIEFYIDNNKFKKSISNDKNIINLSNENNNKSIEINSRITKYRKNKNLSNDNFNNIDTKDISNNNLIKGKIIKFKYNGAEFFFHPSHNKTHNSFYKLSENLKNKNRDIIKASKIIQKWWKKTIFIKLLIIKNKIKFLFNTIKNITLRSGFINLKNRIIFINEVILIQRKWRQFSYSKKEQITSFEIKNETYGCDNSYFRNDSDNFYINTSEFNNTNEENNKNYKFINNKIVYNKNNILLNNLHSGHLYKKKLFELNKQEYNNAIINKKINKINKCCFTKISYKNIIDKIIFIQKNVKKFLYHLLSYNLRKLYRNIFSNLIITHKFNSLNISDSLYNNFSIYGNDNINNKINTNQINLEEILNINFSIFHNDNKRKKNEVFQIRKNNEIFYERNNTKKNNILNIQKENDIFITFKSIIKPFQFSYDFLTFIPKKYIKKFEDYKINICNNNNIFIKTNKNNIFTVDKNNIQFSIKKQISKNEKITEIIKPPLIKELFFLEKIKINKKYINKIINIQTYYRNIINKKQNYFPKRIIIISNDIITKIYKDNSLDLSNIVKIQKIYRYYLNSKKITYFKPKNLNVYITKKYIGQIGENNFEKLKKNISLKVISQEENENKSAIYYNNINDDFLTEKEDEEKNINDITKYNTINTHRKSSKEKINTSIKYAEEKINKKSLKIIHRKINKKDIRNIRNNVENLNNIKINNTFININTLPSVKSWKINNDNNETSNRETNTKYTNSNKNRKYICRNNNISIQTLESKESRNKFDENINLSYMKRVTTEENKFKLNLMSNEGDNNNNYFYTDNDITRFSFSNGDSYFLNYSLYRTNTKCFLKIRKFINRNSIKMFCSKLRMIIYNINLYIFIHILIKRIQKNIHIIVFYKIFKIKNVTNFYSIIKKHIKIYHKINEDKEIDKNKFLKNDLIKLIKNNIYNKYLYYNLKDKFLYITNEQEKKLIETDLFINNDKDLINYYFLYYKIQYKLLNENYYNLIQFRLIKEPLYNLNIFSITRYMDELYYNFIHDNICKICFCKKNENCSINCNCHDKINNSINLINKIKHKISHNKSFNIDFVKNEESCDLIDIKNQKEKRNIRKIIKRVKRGSADNTRIRTNNNEENIDLCSSNEIDIFQKMNSGIKSLINRVKINKAFKDFNQNKKNKQFKNRIFKIERSYSGLGETDYLNKINNITSFNNIENSKYDTIFYCNKNDNASPEKKAHDIHSMKKIFYKK